MTEEALAMQHIATAFFAAAVVHTFMTKKILELSHRFREGSVGENILHFFGEVEVVFGLWAGALVAVWAARFGTASAVAYTESVNFTEAAFVFVIMCMAATRPVLQFARTSIRAASRLLPLPAAMRLYIATLVIGPILGSFITEPAAMTVTALLVKESFLDQPVSTRFKYATLGLLFVAISIGGTLTHFAAPPVLMVAGPWGWTTPFMFQNFGIRSMIAIVVAVVTTAVVFRKQLERVTIDHGTTTAMLGGETRRTPFWVTASHLGFMALTILNAHHMSFFIPVFLFFLGWCSVTKEYQDELKMRESLLVAFFLGGLVVLGKLQAWWLKPLLAGLDPTALFWGATALTALTDNAALTYLGTLVPNLSDAAKFALVAGAVTGGGLTVIANAPNPAGYGILKPSFGENGISPLGLFLAALPYTLLAAGALLL